jgi:hypothetical protein
MLPLYTTRISGRATIQPYGDRAVYVNALEVVAADGEQRVLDAYGPNYERLAALKKKYRRSSFLLALTWSY